MAPLFSRIYLNSFAGNPEDMGTAMASLAKMESRVTAKAVSNRAKLLKSR